MIPLFHIIQSDTRRPHRARSYRNYISQKFHSDQVLFFELSVWSQNFNSNNVFYTKFLIHNIKLILNNIYKIETIRGTIGRLELFVQLNSFNYYTINIANLFYSNAFVETNVFIVPRFLLN